MFEPLNDFYQDLKNYPYWENFKSLVIETPAEVFIGMGLLWTAFTGADYVHEAAKKGQRPLGFSEIGQTRKLLSHYNPDRTAAEMSVPPLTNSYSITNDVYMMTAEASNLAYTWQIVWEDMNHNFAYEIEKKIDPSMRVHHQITEYAKTAARDTARALGDFKEAASASEDLKPVINSFDASWDAEHDDVYRTVTSEECDSKGNCHTVVSQVYDHTDNYYHYHQKAGEQAAAQLHDFLARHPDIHIPEQLLLASGTNAENEWAMRESRRKLSGYKPLTEKDYMRLTNVWATASNYNVLMPVAYKSHEQLFSLAPQWDAAKETAQPEYYSRSYGGADSGPEEYQTAMTALETARREADAIDRTRGGIVFAGENIPVLYGKIQHFVNAELHGGPGNPTRERREIMNLASEIYNKNFTGGFDTEPFKIFNIIMWGLLGAGLGAGLGFGADRAIDATVGSRGRYRSFDR